MKTFGLFWILSWLIRYPLGQLMLVVAVLWWLDYRYFGIAATLWAPVVRWQRISGMRSAVALNPSDVRAMVELGEHYLRGANYRTAAEYLEKAVDRGEDSARALYLLGGALVKLGRHAEGRAKLEEAVAKTPNVAYGEPYLYLLEEAIATEGARSARVDELVEKLEPFDGVEVQTRAGHICGAAGRTDLARRLLEEAVRNYNYIPKKMRRRSRYWAMRARLGLLQYKA